MRAVRVHAFGPPSVLKLESDVAVPEVGSDQVSATIESSCQGLGCSTKTNVFSSLKI